MDYDRLFSVVRSHLDGLGIQLQLSIGKPATEAALSRAERVMGVRLPDELREFYRSAGDGLSLFWQAAPAAVDRAFASFSVPDLERLAEGHDGWRRTILYSPAEAESYGFPHTEDPALAKRTAAHMWHWLPVQEEGNGDQICLDLSAAGCPVVFDRHDWLDGGTGDNGHVLAPNWSALVEAWAGVCFQQPKNLYWPLCFRPSGGVAWDGGQFLDPYRLPVGD